MNGDSPRLIIMIHRNPRNADLVDYTFTVVWYTGKHTDAKGKKRRERLIDEGTLVYPYPVRDVRVILDEVTARISRRKGAPGDGPGMPGRERSGIENVPLPLDLPPEHQSALAATTQGSSTAVGNHVDEPADPPDVSG